MASTCAEQTNNHENCQDCLRQRALNEKYISIYNQMQVLLDRVIVTKRNVTNHQSQMRETMNQRHNIIEKSKQTRQHLSKLNKNHIEELSLVIAVAVCEQRLRVNLSKENRLLEQQIRATRENRLQNAIIEQQIRQSNATLYVQAQVEGRNQDKDEQGQTNELKVSQADDGNEKTIQQNKGPIQTVIKGDLQSLTTHSNIDQYKYLNLWLYQ